MTPSLRSTPATRTLSRSSKPLFSITCRVSRSSWSWPGVATNDSVPCAIAATYWLGSWPRTVGLGPFTLGPAPRPLAFSTNSVRPLGETARPVGYHAVGIMPRTRPPRAPSSRSSWPRSEIASTSLLPALATNSVRPSGETASAFGLLPSAAPAYGARSNVRVTALVAVLTTETVSLSPFATNSSRLSRLGLASTALGWVPTGMCARTAREAMSTAVRLCSPQLLTYAVAPSRESATPYGWHWAGAPPWNGTSWVVSHGPTGTLVTPPVARSTMPRASPVFSATKSVRPSSEMARPAAKPGTGMLAPSWSWPPSKVYVLTLLLPPA